MIFLSITPNPAGYSYMTHRFFVEKTAMNSQSAMITGSDAKHIKNVMRLKPGDTIHLFDGTGTEYRGQITHLSSGKIEILIKGKHTTRRESSLQLAVAQAFLKDKKMDGLVRQLTELGMTEWFSFHAERSVPVPDTKRLKNRIQRWEKIVRESLKQCRRGVLPTIRTPLSFEALLLEAAPFDLKIIFWEKADCKLEKGLYMTNSSIHSAFIVLGPEGGFSDEEVGKAESAGFITASLGPRILRAETATLAACTLVQFLFGDMG
jgi:16S rRNA (uracil1498-N3)-methyltransferase